MKALFRLNEIKVREGNSGSGEAKKDLGPLPETSRSLIAVIYLVWIVIGAFF